MKRLEGKVALVTGGNSGIGLASAKRLKEEGAKVAITGRNQKTLDEAVKALGNDVVAIQSDVAKTGDIEKVFETVTKKLGKVDVLFANAGVAKFLPPQQVTESHYDEQFDINAKGAYFTIQKSLPYLNDGASVILNTSVVSHKGIPDATVYSATKAAMRSMTRSFAVSLADRKIRVNAVAPGPIETPLFDRMGLPKEAVEEFAKNVTTTIPLKRFGKPEEVAGAVAFLASPDASYITAVELNVDGGFGQV